MTLPRPLVRSWRSLRACFSSHRNSRPVCCHHRWPRCIRVADGHHAARGCPIRPPSQHSALPSFAKPPLRSPRCGRKGANTRFPEHANAALRAQSSPCLQQGWYRLHAKRVLHPIARPLPQGRPSSLCAREARRSLRRRLTTRSVDHCDRKPCCRPQPRARRVAHAERLPPCRLKQPRPAAGFAAGVEAPYHEPARFRSHCC
mmetsp:Transcript_73658/g.204801  ORF Transcript_73658/g.204801 Transcript_73658/m.204801 type:complete len:202 (+) Transcript_73658:943-1548(+)